MFDHIDILRLLADEALYLYNQYIVRGFVRNWALFVAYYVLFDLYFANIL